MENMFSEFWCYFSGEYYLKGTGIEDYTYNSFQGLIEAILSSISYNVNELEYYCKDNPQDHYELTICRELFIKRKEYNLYEPYESDYQEIAIMTLDVERASGSYNINVKRLPYNLELHKKTLIKKYNEGLALIEARRKAEIGSLGEIKGVINYDSSIKNN